MNLTLRNSFHQTERRFRLPKAIENGDYGWAFYLSRRGCQRWLCSYDVCKCSHMIKCLDPGYHVLGVDSEGRIAIAHEEM